MDEMEAALERRKAKREKLNLAKEKREVKKRIQTTLKDTKHESCGAGHAWFEAVHLDGFSRAVEICTEANLEELAWMAKKFGWKVTRRGLWSERNTKR